MIYVMMRRFRSVLPSAGLFSPDAYVTEDGAANYTTENDAAIYTRES